MHNLVRRVIAPLRRHLLLICGALFLLAVVVVWWIFSAPIAPWLHSAQSVDVLSHAHRLCSSLRRQSDLEAILESWGPEGREKAVCT